MAFFFFTGAAAALYEITDWVFFSPPRLFSLFFAVAGIEP